MRIHARQAITALVLAAAAPRGSAGQRPTSSTVAVRPHNTLAAEEIAAFLVLLNAYDRVAYRNQYQDGQRVYASTFSTTWKHLTTQRWVHDIDPFNINQFAHPYQGATMYGLARTTGHGFWSSLLYSNAGSFAWKMAGETDPPSINDMITTGQAGSLLGEALYRMADLVLKNGGPHQPSWHRYLAAVASPPMAVNQRVLGSQFATDLPDTVPATAWQLRLGGITDVVANNLSAPSARLHDVVATFSMAYGLPGAPGYAYTRPLDYFEFQFSFLSRARNPIENVMLRGLLLGRQNGSGPERGIWGLYGSYDYISPYLFRVSSTALSLGTTRQYWLSPVIALQGSALGGVGYGAAGSTTGIPATPTSEAIRDYHFGITPQGLLNLRLIGGERVMLEGTAREYYVSGAGSDDKHGSEQIFRGDFGVNVSLFGGHTVGVHWLESTRHAHYATVPSRSYSEGTVTLTYTFLGHNHFGAVKW